MKYLVVFEKAQGNYGAYLPDLPGCVAVGDTREEIERSIREAVEFHLESIQEHDEPVPAPTAWATEIDIDVPAHAPKKSA